MTETYFLKGTFLDTPVPGEIRVREGCLEVKGGRFGGFFEKLPEGAAQAEVIDYSGKLILPGFTDLHMHAPQYGYCGLAMDLQLLDWLEKYTYPEEARYRDLSYAREGYGYFVRDLLESPTTRSVIFASQHTDATLLLMDMLEEAGLPAYVGKVAMNRNAPDYYSEGTTANGVAETERWITEAGEKGYRLVKPIITPRFTPSVTDDYMEALGQMAAKYHLAAQSHLSESREEKAWVKELRPQDDFYFEAYEKYGLFGGDVPTVMAHCIFCEDEEQAEILRKNVYIAHCPTSNVNVIAGMCPAADYLRNGFRIGLGSDVAGGHTLNLFAVMTAAVQVSKLYWRAIDHRDIPLTMAEAFYMATAGGGSFFGRAGLLEEGFAADAVVIDDSPLRNMRENTPQERLERYAYLGDGKVFAKFAEGKKIR